MKNIYHRVLPAKGVFASLPNNLNLRKLSKLITPHSLILARSPGS